MRNILLIDDNPYHRLIYRKWIEACLDASVIEVDDQQEALAILASESVACVLLDHRLNQVDGLTILPLLEGVPVVFMSSIMPPELRAAALKAGAAACYDKSKDTDGNLIKLIGAAWNP